MKRLLVNLAWGIGALFGGFLLMIVLPGLLWDFPSCGEDSPAVSYARSLSQERLEQLYRDMLHYSEQDGMASFGWEVGITDTEIPEEFSDLQVRKIRPGQGNIMVEGCFDHYIYLTFYGMGPYESDEEGRRIVLNWGERPPNSGRQVLWSER